MATNTPDPQPSIPPEMATVISAGARACREVPGAVALGGSICALYAQHRTSIDIDFVVRDLRARFQDIREHMMDVPGWKEHRVQPPVLILGSLDEVDIGLRQQRRPTPIETVQLQTPAGSLTIPTIDELLRAKAVLAYQRNATRDFADFAELSLLISQERLMGALDGIDALFGGDRQSSLGLEIAKALLRCEPVDSADREFHTLMWLRPRLSTWIMIQDRCREIGQQLAERLIDTDPAPPAP